MVLFSFVLGITCKGMVVLEAEAEAEGRMVGQVENKVYSMSLL